MRKKLDLNCKIFLNFSAKTASSTSRQRCFSHWKTSYNEGNDDMFSKKDEEYTKSTIFEHFLPKYHNYHKALYNTENVKSIGIHGDIPYEKFSNPTQKFNGRQLQYNDNHLLGLGTTKTTFNIPGYQGFMPKNQQKFHYTNRDDPYTNVNKTNHIQNYKTRIPRYQGHTSINPVNIKGVPRPYCLSTEGEKFN